LLKRIKKYQDELETMVQAHEMAVQIRDRLVTKIQKVAATYLLPSIIDLLNNKQ
jgi:hypothetical protein